MNGGLVSPYEHPTITGGIDGSVTMTILTGACHCGATHWTLEGDPGPATACNCTLCRRYGTLWAYDYENERIRIFGPSAARQRRARGTGAAA